MSQQQYQKPQKLQHEILFLICFSKILGLIMNAKIKDIIMLVKTASKNHVSATVLKVPKITT